MGNNRFRFRNKTDKRTPGFYGQFHEGGWAPDRKFVKVPHHFLKSAKRNRASLEKELQITLSDVMDITRRNVVVKVEINSDF